MATILIVEDNATLRQGMSDVVERADHTPVLAENGAEGLEKFEQIQPPIVITDLKMDELDGMGLLQQIREQSEDTIVMIVTAYGTIEKAVDAMKEGAFDFIPKPFPPDLLRTKIEKALDVREDRQRADRLQSENEMLRRDLGVDYDTGIIGSSDEMQAVYRKIQKVAPTGSNVYIYGESGTGKELVARQIHRLSDRAEEAFIQVNCAALPSQLLESELFGHEKGAFTGADRRKLGRFELADGGTILLDEIGEISEDMQVKLLRVLQEQAFTRVGGEQTIEVDIRVIAATNRDLESAVEEGKFREDLFYRLHIIPIHLPPLRERKADIPELAEHFVDKLASRTRSRVDTITPDAMEALKAYSWPGNVRQLENAIEHGLVFAESEQLRIDDLPAEITGRSPSDNVDVEQGDRTLPQILEDLEEQLIRKAYREAEGVKTDAAKKLGIKTSALYYKLDKYDID